MIGAFDLARCADQQCAIAVHFGIDGLSKFRRTHGRPGSRRRPAREQGRRLSMRPFNSNWAPAGPNSTGIEVAPQSRADNAFAKSASVNQA